MNKHFVEYLALSLLSSGICVCLCALLSPLPWGVAILATLAPPVFSVFLLSLEAYAAPRKERCLASEKFLAPFVREKFEVVTSDDMLPWEACVEYSPLWKIPYRISYATKIMPDHKDAVLAHEAAHIALGHLRFRNRMMNARLCVVFSLLLAFPFMIKSEPSPLLVLSFCCALLALVVVQNMGLLFLSRKNELAADSLAAVWTGCQILSLLHYLEGLEQNKVLSPSGSFMSTHPSMKERQNNIYPSLSLELL